MNIPIGIASKNVWKRVALGEVLTLFNGRAYQQNELLDQGTPVIRIQNLNGGANWYYSNLKLPNEKYCENGDLLFAWSGTFGPYFWSGPRAIYHYHIWKIIPSPSLDRKYAFYLLQSITSRVKASGRGISMIHMTKSAMEAWEVDLPPLDEQRRIAAILDKADALRRKRKRALDLLDGLTQSTFFDLFGQTGDPISKWGGPIPLSDLAEIGSGITKGRKLNGQTTRQISYLAVANVQDRRLELAKVKVIDATEDEISRYKLQKDDLLLTEGGDPDKLGRGTLWAGELSEAIHQNHIFRVRVKSDSILPLFLNWLVGSPYGKRYFLGVAKQTTGIASINKTQLSGFPVIVPPIDLQRRFVCFAERVAVEGRRFTSSLCDTEALFSSLQSRAFSGQL